MTDFESHEMEVSSSYLFGTSLALSTALRLLDPLDERYVFRSSAQERGLAVDVLISVIARCAR